jgi:3-hydroxyacyl-CoA dehydrogenase/enoyl-CoA hydratase/3-hydroxybutyryl-CoA epimerase
LPEVKLGLIPAWGGTQRLPKRVGLMRALPMVLEGQLLSAKKAYRAGLVDALISAPDSQSEIDLFVNDRLAHKPVHRPQRTWMQWAVNCTSFGRKAALKKAREGVRKYAQHYPALNRIIEAVETGLRFPTVNEEGLRAEREAFKDLLFGPVAPNLINIFMMQEKAKKSSTWTSDAQPREVKKIAVIGAGTMGAGIAQQAASRGYSVILQDVKDEFVNRGMDTIKGLFSKAVSKGAVPQAEADAALARTQPRVDWGPSDDVDLMIEAIIERLEVKEAVFRKADELLPAQAVLASNTSALPIEEMAKVTGRPAQVAGLHFFNPVHKMPLVEVVRAPQTSDETIATLVGVAKKLGKIPVVVKQSPGFLVNRILFPYLDEAARLVTEGYGVSDIDKAAKKFGMPMGPIELLDVVGIDVAFDVSKTLSPLSQEPTPTPDLFQRMVNAGLKGQKTGKGFFEWKDGKKAGPTSIPGLDAAARPPALPDWTVTGETFGAIQQRLVLSMLNEARKCLAEEVVTEPWMVDLGMVLGTGFAPFRGGPMRCIERWGADEVQARLRLLAEKCGRRFQPVEVSAGEHAVNKA